MKENKKYRTANLGDNQKGKSNGKSRTLTTRQGHPVTDNQNIRTVGNRGPATMENYHFIEKISHFDRERVPERVVHARGAGAHGVFEAYGTVGNDPVEKFTRAKVFKKGKQTPTFVRFSTVGHGTHSPETLRDPRGFAVKFYTEDGNWDLVGNNLKIFFIRDAMKFPDLIHSQKPDPVTNIQSAERIFDFFSGTPEATHMVTFLYSPWGIPANYRQMQGSGVNTYKWVNADGEAVLVKYHWEPMKQGIRNLTQKEAQEIQGKNFNHATQDLYEAIDRGDFPEWELNVQIMSDEEHPELDFDPLDDTKLWPKEQFPWYPVGKMTLNRNPVDYFNEVELSAFGTGVLVDGLDFSDDKMLQGRTFSYSDTQRYRVGANYLQLPINAAKTHVATNQRGGQMAFDTDFAEGQNIHVNYEPSILGGLEEAPKPEKEYMPRYEANLVRQHIDRTNHFGQAGETFRNFEDWERDELINNLGNDLAKCDPRIQEKMLSYFTQADEDYGRRVKESIERATEEKKKMMKHDKIAGTDGPSGNVTGEEGVEQAQSESHSAKPY
ncbi:catalase [Pontibacter kalidii]|uniref:catalase n=1 Tax=Pontibacter kalidii TaxID=2592049 RepID=UPI002251B8D4|nr:catalase [Pontibacter kalidii]